MRQILLFTILGLGILAADAQMPGMGRP
ncbi:MAG: hypothetical protein RLZZ28_1342, partial [Bacteroidota bacterium]